MMELPSFLRASALVKPGETHSSLTKATLSLNATNEAFKLGKRAYAAQKYDDAVKHYTCALEALQADISSVIYVHRAAAYEMQNKYTFAVQDGKAANPDSNSTCPDPYFALANALFLNNQLSDAEKVYQQGARAVPQTNPKWTAIALKHTQVSTYKENQNQLMVQLLPYEVLSEILLQLSIKERARLGMTCRFWYNYMFRKWPHMWHTIDLEDDFPFFTLNPITQAYLGAICGDQVKDLHLQFLDSQYDDSYSDYSDGYGRCDHGNREVDDSGSVLLDYIDKQWHGVESLTIDHCDELSFNFVSRVVKEGLKTLTLCQSTHLRYYGIEMLDKAARSFPKLHTMINYLDKRRSISLSSYLENTTQLSNFQLTAISLPRPMGRFDELLLYTPALVSLTINSYYVHDYATLLESVYVYCPALEVLNYSPNATHDICATHTQPEASSSTASGLRTLVFQPSKVQSFTNINKSLAMIFQKSCKTLQTLKLHLDSLENGQFSALQTLFQFGAPRIQTLILNATNKCTIVSQQVCNLISASPSLVTVNLTGTNFWHDKILDTLARLHRIQRVSIGFVYRGSNIPKAGKGEDGRITTNGLRTFFKASQTIYEFSYHCPGYVITPKSSFILGLIRAVSSSTVRSLDLSSSRLTTETLSPFLLYLKNSRVQTLKIRVACPIGDDELSRFANVKGLTHLIVHDNDYNFKEEHVCKLLDRWEYPQMLVVHIRRKEPEYFIKGHKGDLATVRLAKAHITDPMVRYSIKSSNPTYSEVHKMEPNHPKAYFTI